jgi:hypothetical protein
MYTLILFFIFVSFEPKLWPHLSGLSFNPTMSSSLGISPNGEGTMYNVPHFPDSRGLLRHCGIVSVHLCSVAICDNRNFSTRGSARVSIVTTRPYTNIVPVALYVSFIRTHR